MIVFKLEMLGVGFVPVKWSDNDMVGELVKWQYFLAQHAEKCNVSETIVVDQALSVLPRDSVF